MAKTNLLTLHEPLPEVKITHDVVLLSQDDERALINLVSDSIREAILNIAQNHSEFLELSERRLQSILQPSDTDDKLRICFWREYNRAQDLGTGMKMSNIYSPVMSKENFLKLLENPRRVAWIIKPPEEYMVSLEASLNHGKENLNALMKMNLFDEKGNLKKAEASIFVKAYELLDNRVKGAVVQRIEQKTASLHVHKKETSEDELKQRLEKLRLQQEETAIEITAKGSEQEGS